MAKLSQADIFINNGMGMEHWAEKVANNTADKLGLFYDEAAHFTYLLYNHGGKVKVLDSTATYTNDDGNTPDVLSVNAVAGKIPVHMFLNFNSPVCEWYYIVNFEKRIVLYDLFKTALKLSFLIISSVKYIFTGAEPLSL